MASMLVKLASKGMKAAGPLKKVLKKQAKNAASEIFKSAKEEAKNKAKEFIKNAGISPKGDIQQTTSFGKHLKIDIRYLKSLH